MVKVRHTSRVGKGGHHAPPGNQFLFDAARQKKLCRKRLAMLKSCQNVSHTFYVQISAVIIENSLLWYISANSACKYANKIFIPIF